MECVDHNCDIKHNYIREIISYCDLWERGLEIVHTSDMPSRSGLGSSSTFITALWCALEKLQLRVYDKGTVAIKIYDIEQNVLKETVGRQDHLFAIYGGFQHIYFESDGYLPGPLLTKCIKTLNEHSLLFYVGERKENASHIAASYVPSLLEKEKIMKKLVRKTTEAMDVLCDEDMSYLGQLVHEGWLCKYSLSPKISNAYIDEAYSIALACGAYGGKLCGSGGGGCLYIIAPPERQTNIIDSMKWKGFRHIPFQFETESKGVEIIHG